LGTGRSRSPNRGVMQIRLTRKLCDWLDGVNLHEHRVGDVFDVPRQDGELLIAEKWAVAAPGRPFRKMSTVAGAIPSRIDDRCAVLTMQQLWPLGNPAPYRTFGEQAKRRAEDRYRNELQDSRAKTVSPGAGRRRPRGRRGRPGQSSSLTTVR